MFINIIYLQLKKKIEQEKRNKKSVENIVAMQTLLAANTDYVRIKNTSNKPL